MKKALLERYDEWQRRYPDGPPPDQELTPNGKLHTTLDDRDDPSPRSHTDINIAAAEEAHIRAAQQRVAEEASLWRAQREAAERRDAEMRAAKREAAAAAARQAAQPLVGAGSFNAPHQQLSAQQQDEMFRRQQDEMFRRQQAADEQARAMRKQPPVGAGSMNASQQQQEEMVRRQQEDMIRRQQAADDQARAIRQGYSSPAPSAPPSAHPTGGMYPAYPTLPQTQSYQEAPMMMPLENPSAYEGDSTDSESVHMDFHNRRQRQHPQQNRAPLI